jgi:hypothetical protein
MNSLSCARALRSILQPEIAARSIIKHFSIGSLDFRLSLQALDRPHYAFGVKQAVYLAKKLKHSEVSVVELGVARGDGLLALERYATQIGKQQGIKVEVYGFDLGSGLPSAVDYRDLSYVWQRGAYKMDVEGLQKRLTSAKLMLGNVRDTVDKFLQTDHAPIGFISFDMDYYSSTVAGLALLQAKEEALLPRVLCYFDDVVSDGHQLHCDCVGELLAIREFNEGANGKYTLAQMGNINSYVLSPDIWMQQIWVYHRFGHFEYNEYIGR